MEHTVNERVITLVKLKEKNTLAFELACGLKRGGLSGTIRGNNPSFDVIQSILKTYPDVSPNWLIKGEGQMFLDDEPEIKEDPETVSLLRKALDGLQGQLEKADKRMDDLIKQNNMMLNIINNNLGKYRGILPYSGQSVFRMQA